MKPNNLYIYIYKKFDMKDLGEASYVLGIEIHQVR